MSSVQGVHERLQPTHPVTSVTHETPATQALIDKLALIAHIEGGYFSEIDRNPLTIPNPFLTIPNQGDEDVNHTTELPFSGDNSLRNASTSIFYLLTPVRPQGHFHRNKGRTVHTLIRGRGRYVLIHADEDGVHGKKRVESFVVGKNVVRGEQAVWVVEGGKFKASFLLDGEGEDEELLISETVVPGFEYSDHDFLTKEKFDSLVEPDQIKELEWLVRKD